MDKFVIKKNIPLVEKSNENARKVKSDGKKIEQIEYDMLTVDLGLRIQF